MSQADTSADLSIIIVSWNVRDYVAACLESIQAGKGNLSIEVVVVESGSTDGTVETLRSGYAWVKLLAQLENIGFTRGNNVGLAAASGRQLMLLNPDTEIVGDALPQMVAYLDAHPDVGIVGPHTLNSDGTTQSTRRRFPTVLTALFESTWLQRFGPRRMLDRYYVRDIADTDTAGVDWVQGSALMARREVYERIGGVDEQSVMFSEELDWCKRARDHGWRVIYLGTANIVHHGGKSTEQVAAFNHVNFQPSKIRYFRKFHGPFVALMLRLFLVVSYSQQLVIQAAKGAIGRRPDLRRERVGIYWQVIRSLTGLQS